MIIHKDSNPDVLLCLANLSSDEVFTPPKIANDMLDLLPPEIFTNPDAKFLDPASKSGVFLREIVKRLIIGLSDKIPDFEQRVNHILKQQIFGLAITHLTGLISRRTVYCSKDASGKFSACRFDTHDGNILFHDVRHSFDSQGRCTLCGAKIESNAYEFIHTLEPEEIFNMKFDGIISNPPYQLSDGGFGASALPVYNKFVEQAIKLQPRYLTMIIPARWYAGGKGLDEFRDKMLHDRHIRKLHDFFNSEECFQGVDLSGGVCYFLWDRDNEGACEVTSSLNGEQTTMTRELSEDGTFFQRFNGAVTITRKISAMKEESFAKLVSSRKPFGFDSTELGESFSEVNNVRFYANKNAQKEASYISRNRIKANISWVDKYKVFISYSYGERGELPYFATGKPFVGEPNSCCSETYLVIGPFDDESTCKNVISYITTKFFRFLVMLRKPTQHATKSVYEFVPMQDFTRSWTDSELYAKYNLDSDEIAFIESMIKPMNLES
ncbi:MAG: Eco57I restriction-modification methylase domain-containing protein [Synergistaceae bacterium]|nr:Eco57I restriction-modification methylase domain-containing protein [Synergistaceae bacterium]